MGFQYKFRARKDKKATTASRELGGFPYAGNFPGI
jgi:hypothetical protein